MKHIKTFESFQQEHIDESMPWHSKERKASDLTKKKEDAIDTIMNHPSKRAAYLDWKKKDAEIADKYVEFEMKNPDVMYREWDPSKKEFVSTGKFKVASGEGSGGKIG